MDTLNSIMSTINAFLWHDMVLYFILGVGVLFLIWSKFCPILALTHGVQVIRGKYDHANDPGAISHFQALSAALSATVGLGNIGGVAMAISLGGPGAVFWMWVVGFVGMALKMTEVTQSMLYRNTSDKDNPHGGPMFVAAEGFKKISPSLAPLGRIIGFIFCITLLISTITGGNMFQAWNVGEVTEQNFGIPSFITGIILAIVCALVIIGGIKRIGHVAGKLVPFMCGLYFLCGIAVIIARIDVVPEVFRLIISSAFNPIEAQGAFIGGSLGYAFLYGMKRALFSNEAGQGSAPIAHSAAMTDEPVREGIVAGLEPFIDTLVVCSLTALVILTSGVWKRPPELYLEQKPEITFNETTKNYELAVSPLTQEQADKLAASHQVFMFIQTGQIDPNTGNDLKPVLGEIAYDIHKKPFIQWSTLSGLTKKPEIKDGGVFLNFDGAGLTSFAFDSVFSGLGKYLVTLAAWLFAISTMISWSYYGEQGVVFMFGERWIMSYKMLYCVLIIVSTSGFITSTDELDNLTGIGTGVMLFANIPIMLIFGKQAMDAYFKYVKDLRSGKFDKPLKSNN